MRKLLRSVVSLIVVAAMGGGAAYAQNRTFYAGTANAADFAYGGPALFPLASAPPALLVDVAGGPTAIGVATLSVAFGQISLGDGTVITPLNVNAPVRVGIGANQETVTPTAVSCNTPQIYQSCTFTATFTHQHGTGDPVASGSFGLQEAANWLEGRNGGLVILSPIFLKNAALTTNAAVTAFLLNYLSPGINVTVLNYSGIAGALSYTAAVNVAYASTTHVIY